MMDEKMFLGILVTLATALISWLFKTIFNRIDKNEEAVRKLAESMEAKYQSKEVAREMNKGVTDKLDDISEQLRQVNNKLDKKADR